MSFIGKELILVKLGGSLITAKNKPYKAKPAIIRRLAKEIKAGWKKGVYFLIAHGSGSFGHTSAAKYQTADGIKKKKDVFGLAVVQQDAFQINSLVNKIFIEEGLPILSFVPSSFTLAHGKKLKRIFIEPIIQALKVGALPLVFGDVILDEKNGCCIFSGETTLDNLIAPLTSASYKITKIIQAGMTDGVYDERGETIPVITPNSLHHFKKAIGSSQATDVTGGMLHKVEESLEIASKRGIETVIINGSLANRLRKAILGKIIQGTLITSQVSIALVDGSDQVVGYREKYATHQNPVPLHRAVSVIILDKNGQRMLLQKRAGGKPTWPLFWSNASCTHPLRGESYQAAAERRLKEEMGIITRLKEVFKFTYKAKYNETWGEHELDTVFIGRYSGEVRPDPSEATAFKWVELKKLIREIKKTPELYTPWFKIILKKLELH